MALASLQRRTARLAKVFVIDPVAGYPPLTAEEMEALVERKGSGQKWTELETARVIKQCPYRHALLELALPLSEREGGELVISAREGEVAIKRYVGIDPSWV